MQTRILLINVHSSYNAGDAALTQAAIDQLQGNFPGSQIRLMMNDPQSHSGPEETIQSFQPWVQEAGKNQLARFSWWVLVSLTSILSKRWFSKAIFLPGSSDLRPGLQATLEADLVVSTPGGYLYSYGKGRALIILLFTLALAILAGKPLYLFPQSFGPFRYRREKWLVKWVISRARVVMARESVSVQHLGSCGISPERCVILPDMAFIFQAAAPQAALDWLTACGIDPQKDRPLVGVTAIDWGAQFQGFDRQSKYEAGLAGALRTFLSKHGGRAILLPQCWGPTQNEDDRLPAARIANRLKDLSGAVLAVNTPLAPDLLKAVFGQMDLFIGTRMHSNIFALSQAVPVIAIGYLHKTEGIARSVGIEGWVLDIQQVDEERLSQKLEELWSERQPVRRALEARLPILTQETLRAGEIVAADFANYSKAAKHG